MYRKYLTDLFCGSYYYFFASPIPTFSMNRKISSSLHSLIMCAVSVAASLALAGCSSLEKGLPQEVTIVSFPSEASIYINGEPMGITPMQIELPRKVTHEVKLEKNGYNSALKYFAPVANEKANNFIRFGLSEDLGHYVDLEPRTMQTDMQSELVPSSVGADPFARMARQALQADSLLEAGKITPEEHKHAIEQIISFFNANI